MAVPTADADILAVAAAAPATLVAVGLIVLRIILWLLVIKPF